MDTSKETTFKIATILFGVLSGILGLILTLSFAVVFKVHKEVKIIKSRHVKINTAPNESYAIFGNWCFYLALVFAKVFFIQVVQRQVLMLQLI